MSEARFWTLDFDERDHRADLNASVLVCVVDEEAGGIVAYATGEQEAWRIVAALNAAAGCEDGAGPCIRPVVGERGAVGWVRDE